MKFSSSFVSLAYFVAFVTAAPADVKDTESSVQSEDFLLPPCKEGTYWSHNRCVVNACKYYSFSHNNPKACGDEHWTRDESSVQSEDFLLPPCEKGTYWSHNRCVVDACKYYSFSHNNPKACGDEHWTRDESSVQSEDYLKPRCHTGKFWYNGRCLPDACSFPDYQRRHRGVCGSDWPTSEPSAEKRSEDLIRHCGFTETWNGHKCVPSDCLYDEHYRHEHKGVCGNWPASESSVEKRSGHCGFTETWNGHKCVPSECLYDEQYRHEHKNVCGNW